jgi:hypothetical protein
MVFNYRQLVFTYATASEKLSCRLPEYTINHEIMRHFLDSIARRPIEFVIWADFFVKRLIELRIIIDVTSANSQAIFELQSNRRPDCLPAVEHRKHDLWKFNRMNSNEAFCCEFNSIKRLQNEMEKCELSGGELQFCVWRSLMIKLVIVLQHKTTWIMRTFVVDFWSWVIQATISSLVTNEISWNLSSKSHEKASKNRWTNYPTPKPTTQSLVTWIMRTIAQRSLIIIGGSDDGERKNHVMMEGTSSFKIVQRQQTGYFSFLW